MTIGKSKKPEKAEATNQNLKGGLSTQEAAAIVRAATRGVSPFRPEMHKNDSAQGESGPGQTKPGGVDEDWIAKTIAKTAALVSSGVASVSKEEMIKAERLKRAKMFASMIKSSSGDGGGLPLPHLLNKVESTKVEVKGSGSNSGVVEGDNSKKEKLEFRGSEREKRHNKNYRKRDDSPEGREKSERKREKYSDEESCEESPGHHKKRHKHKHHSEHSKRKHSSSDEERERTERKRERHSHKDREGRSRRRERSHHRKDYSSSDSEEDRHRRRSHRDEQRKLSSRRSRDERESSVSNAGEKREDSADVPDELRAKIRAMLLQTL